MNIFGIASLRKTTRELETVAARLEEQNKRLVAEMIEDENRRRSWKLSVTGMDGEQHVIPLRCSRKQVRKVKIALHDAGADALAVETGVPA